MPAGSPLLRSLDASKSTFCRSLTRSFLCQRSMWTEMWHKGQEQEIIVGTQETPSPSADGQFRGTYAMTTNVEAQTWIVTSCGDGCARVSASGPNIQSWSADAQLVNGTWMIAVSRPDAVQCIRQRTTGSALFDRRVAHWGLCHHRHSRREHL